MQLKSSARINKLLNTSKYFQTAAFAGYSLYLGSIKNFMINIKKIAYYLLSFLVGHSEFRVSIQEIPEERSPKT